MKLEVCESKGINLIFGIFFMAIVIGIYFTISLESAEFKRFFNVLYLLFGSVSVGFFIKAFRKNRIILINENGIIYKRKEICNWNNFRNAFIGQEYPHTDMVNAGLDDRTYIIVEYYDHEHSTNFTYRMRMSNTQNKSEEQIINAIENFSGMVLSKEIFSI